MMLRKLIYSLIFISLHGLVYAQLTTSKMEDYKNMSSQMQLGLQAAMDNNPEKAISIFDKTLDEAISKHYVELVPIIVVAQSRLHAIKNEFEKGLHKLKIAEPYIKKDSMTSIAGDFYEYKAQCYLFLKRYEEALVALKQSEAIRLKVEPAKNWRTYNGMSRVYHKLKRHDEAENYAHEAEKLAKIQNSRRVLIDLQNDLQFDEKDGTIAALSTEKNNAIKNLNRTQKQNILLLGGIGVITLITVLLFIILRQRSKLNEEMKAKNYLITKSLSEKEFLIKEIHHRVKNNLQVISSLLSLQSRTVEDQNTVNVLNESQSRILSMSLIHQNLYKDGPSSHLNVKSYLTNLTEQIFNLYNIQKEKIKLRTEVDDITLDVASLVPLGLIVNELITNALKYAFIDREHGVISLSLKNEEDNIVLKVSDDGIGKSEIQNKEGFGTRLIQAFAKRLNGELSYYIDKGTSIELKMSDSKLVV